MSKMLVKMPMHNVFIECAVGNETNERVAKAMVDTRIAPLIEAISKRRPAWTFVVRNGYAGYSTTYGGYPYSGFEIVQDDETLGHIGIHVNWRDGTYQYELNSPRIRNAQLRSASKKTKHLSKAVKIVLEGMMAQTLAERMGQANRDTATKVSDMNNRATWAVDSTIRSSRDALLDHLLANWETAQNIPMPDVTTAKSFQELPEKVRMHRILRSVVASREKHEGAVVKVIGDNYVLTHGKDYNTMVRFTHETVPAPVAMAVGMLKLVSESTAIEDIGVRINADTFFVLNTGPIDEEQQQP